MKKTNKFGLVSLLIFNNLKCLCVIDKSTVDFIIFYHLELMITLWQNIFKVSCIYSWKVNYSDAFLRILFICIILKIKIKILSLYKLYSY